MWGSVVQNKKLSYFRIVCAILTSILLVVGFQNCGSDFTAPQEVVSTELPSEELPPVPQTPLCTPGNHMENGLCVSDRRSCPATNGIAEQIWNGSNYGTCTVVSCNSGYMNQANACIISPTSCPIVNGNGQLQNNVCRVVSCNTSYHVNGNVCDSNTRTCAITNGTGRETWNGTADGSCQVLTCNANFHINGNTCESNTQLCSVANGVGMRTWNGTAFGSCLVTSCNVGYVSTGNTCVLEQTGGSSSWSPRSSARFFISGHSLTDDPLAGLIVDVANKRGDTVAYNQQIVGGSPIRVRTRGLGSSGWSGYSLGKNRSGDNMNVISELRNPQTIGAGQRYDTLVITENHNSLEQIQWEDTIGYLRHFHDRLIEGNSSARTLFYNGWLDINKSNPATWIDHEKKATGAWECVTSKVNLSLGALGRTDRILNMPTGAALVQLVERVLADQVPGITGTATQKLNMIFSDNVHLTQLGVYYMSLVTYSSVYGKTSAGAAAPSGINAGTASEMQRIAWDFINAYYNRNNPGTRTMADCRTYVSQQVCPSYWTLKGNTGNVSNCQNFYGSSTNSPFRWPDSSFVAYPAP